jgi:hypothetical protein
MERFQVHDNIHPVILLILRDASTKINHEDGPNFFRNEYASIKDFQKQLLVAGSPDQKKMYLNSLIDSGTEYFSRMI